ncbi:hypothetical protein HMI54_001838 [Coelomomyces lativittatus]|nr:hypothetical protein HMI54_001838 [Coelomomyces lativittatus]KAJ1512018.1 hypothetical protein HMI56_004628 [Coelomomyces lativittatus]KAJ1516123.1 hypothetical protein HMI55_002923 [Coelomomyces lativittatus]
MSTSSPCIVTTTTTLRALLVKNVSGRPWKTIHGKPTTSLQSGSPSFQTRLHQTKRMKEMKQQEKQLHLKVKEQKETLKQQRKQKKLKQLENTLKAEQVQSVSSRKVKRMSKKQYIANQIQFRIDPHASPKIYGDLE